ncbi:MAG TPA: hemerythrin domain-containing protein [Hydrogenophaga sp.]|uniref:hemerythrin domain-containing protein n=1 Tax=Hydrogenophaga sp. TaxID=1904254 RepID=UPI002C35DD64|nr:hemerythrin domain-containing protein [Hydrogenophaga sp.]HMN92622.1 hemerythrin domain-containing protein [Hydrogenophaga sp.]HMP09205.1 hemerythrin domain-containing protein [Hydrogenophaga sp.]
MNRQALQVIRDEHASLAAMLRSLVQMLRRGPAPDGRDEHERYFDVLRAMLFYIDEFPEKLHHPKETELLFPRIVQASPEVAQAIAQLDRDHEVSEGKVRELMHLLMAWEYLGDTRRQAFEDAAKLYVERYLQHMSLEETVVLPAAEKSLSDADWHALNAAFATNQDPLNARIPRDPQFDRLFTRIVMKAPAPVGLGQD